MPTSPEVYKNVKTGERIVHNGTEWVPLEVGTTVMGMLYAGQDKSGKHKWVPAPKANVTGPSASIYNLGEQVRQKNMEAVPADVYERLGLDEAADSVNQGAAAVRGLQDFIYPIIQKGFALGDALGIGFMGRAGRDMTKEYEQQEGDFGVSGAGDYPLTRLSASVAPWMAAGTPAMGPRASMALSPLFGAAGGALSFMAPWGEDGMDVGSLAMPSVVGGVLGSIPGVAYGIRNLNRVKRLDELVGLEPYERANREGIFGMSATRDWTSMPRDIDENVASLKGGGLLEEDFALTAPQRYQTARSLNAAKIVNQTNPDDMLILHQEQMRRVMGGWGRLARAMRPAGVAANEFGEYLRNGFANAYEEALRIRNGRGLFDEALEEFGDQRVIPVSGFRKKLDDLIETYRPRTEASNTSARETYDALLEYRRTFDEATGAAPPTTRPTVEGSGTIDYTKPIRVPGRRPEDPMVSVQWIQSELEGLSTNAGFRDVSPTAAKIRAAAGSTYADRQLRTALLDDLGAADKGKKLVEARKLWEQDSIVLEELESSALGRIFKDRNVSTSSALKKFWNMTPQEIDESFGLLSTVRPDVADAARAEFLDHILGNKVFGASRKATVDDTSVARYLDLRNQGGGAKRDLFEVLFEGSPWKAEADKLVEVAKRVLSTVPADAKGMSGAMPAMRNELMDVSGQRALINMLMGGSLRSVLMFGAPAAEPVLKAAIYRKAMMDPEYIGKLEEALRSTTIGRAALTAGSIAGSAE